MNLPNIKDARRRSKDKESVYYDKYNIPENIENITINVIIIDVLFFKFIPPLNFYSLYAKPFTRLICYTSY